MKRNWTNFKAVVDENQTDYFESDDADNLSYRLRTTVGAELYECNVMKSPAGNADLVDYETNYRAYAKTGG